MNPLHLMQRITKPELAKRYIEEQIKELREQIGDKKVLLALSGGVDSSVVAALLIKAIGQQLVCVHVNHGLLRKGEPEQVIQVFRNEMNANLIYVDATDRFLDKLAGVTDPEQKRKIAGAFASGSKKIDILFREAKGVLENMARYTHMEALVFKKEEKPVWSDNVVWLNIYTGDACIGNMGLLSKKVSLDCGIKNLSVILFEIDTTMLKPLISRTNSFEHLAEYPETDYDISMLFDVNTTWAEIYDSILGPKKAAALLKDARFIDEYRGKQVPEGKKSVTIRLTIASPEKTLTSQEIEQVAGQVMNKLSKKVGGELRTQ